MPTWNLLTVRQSVQAAGMKLPAELSASIRAGATLFAMMGDQSRCKRVTVELKAFPTEAQAAMANAVRAILRGWRAAGCPYGVPSLSVA